MVVLRCRLDSVDEGLSSGMTVAATIFVIDWLDETWMSP